MQHDRISDAQAILCAFTVDELEQLVDWADANSATTAAERELRGRLRRLAAVTRTRHPRARALTGQVISR